jgi:ATP-binding cassette subfamily C protein LapB
MVPVSAAIATVAKLYQNLSQIAALADILQAKQERLQSDPAIGAARIKGQIRAKGLHYTFAGSAEKCLENVDLNIEAGEKIALIGRTGSGKSTLLQILAGLLPIEQGKIAVDGHAMDRFATAHLRRDIVYSAQDASLFDATIWDNILLGMAEPDAAMVERAIRCSGLNGFVAHRVEGYMRQVGPRGSALSSGQRQAVLLARALLRDPAVLLLDEPTATLDITSEQAVIAGLREAAAGKTLLIATHRLALLDLVDRVIWLEDGKIIADKPKLEVLAMMRRPEHGPQTTQTTGYAA